MIIILRKFSRKMPGYSSGTNNDKQIISFIALNDGTAKEYLLSEGFIIADR